MTLLEIEQSDKPFLVPTDLREVLKCNPYSINVQARTNPEKLGFKVSVMGNRVRIPRVAFLNWLKGDNTETDV